MTFLSKVPISVVCLTGGLVFGYVLGGLILSDPPGTLYSATVLQSMDPIQVTSSHPATLDKAVCEKDLQETKERAAEFQKANPNNGVTILFSEHCFIVKPL